MHADALPGRGDGCILLLAPTRRDAEVTIGLLRQAGIACTSCPDLATLAAQLAEGVGAVLLTDDALVDPAMYGLQQALARQPGWSDVPVLVLTRDRELPPRASLVLATLTNVTLLDRPVSARALVSAVLAALRARRRQHQIRDQLERQRAAEQALRDADRRKDEFLATLAHELRNPLAPIRTALEVLNRLPADSPQAPRLREMMGRQIGQFVKLIDELLDVSRIATGKVLLRRERVELRRVVEAALEDAQPVLGASRHTLQVQWPDAPVWVLGDHSRLAQVFANLLNNAAKYTVAGGRIEVALRRAGRHATISVADNGAGIPPEMLESVFGMFTQVNRTLDRAQGGLGIGLSLVRRLVELHGGSVHAASAGLDRGSTFTVSLPIVEPVATPAPASVADPAAPARVLRVLVADDNVDAADALALHLEAAGHRVRAVYGGAAALAAAHSFRPELVLCDIGMPEVDGHAVARALRADPELAPAMLVALTGWGSEADRRRSHDTGFDVHLVKPVDLEALDALLARL